MLGRPTILRLTAAAAAAMSLAALAGCNTVQGAGRDLSWLGNSMANVGGGSDREVAFDVYAYDVNEFSTPRTAGQYGSQPYSQYGSQQYGSQQQYSEPSAQADQQAQGQAEGQIGQQDADAGQQDRMAQFDRQQRQLDQERQDLSRRLRELDQRQQQLDQQRRQAQAAQPGFEQDVDRDVDIDIGT